MTREEFVAVLTKPGLNILAPSCCRQCCHLTARRTCAIWAFPVTKWRSGQQCPQFSSGPEPEICGIPSSDIDDL